MSVLTQKAKDIVSSVQLAFVHNDRAAAEAAVEAALFDVKAETRVSTIEMVIKALRGRSQKWNNRSTELGGDDIFSTYALEASACADSLEKLLLEKLKN